MVYSGEVYPRFIQLSSTNGIFPVECRWTMKSFIDMALIAESEDVMNRSKRSLLSLTTPSNCVTRGLQETTGAVMTFYKCIYVTWCSMYNRSVHIRILAHTHGHTHTHEDIRILCNV